SPPSPTTTTTPPTHRHQLSLLGGRPMTEDWLLVAIDDVVRAALAVQAELSAVEDVLGPVRADRIAEVDLPTLAAALANRGAEPRRRAATAFQEYEQAVAMLRARVVRALVDE